MGLEKGAYVLGAFIKELRLKRGLKQSELAQMASISREAVGNYERGDRIPNIEITQKIATALEVDINELLDKNNEGKSPGETLLSKRLFELREEKGLNQSDVADAVGISYISVGNYENAARIPKADVVVKLADFFDVSSDYLLGRTNIRKPEAPLTEVLEAIKTGMDFLITEKYLSLFFNALLPKSAQNDAQCFYSIANNIKFFREKAKLTQKDLADKIGCTINSTGKLIKAARKAKKLTQKQLADRIGKAEVTVRQYESGTIETPMSVLRRISNALDIPVTQLIETR